MADDGKWLRNQTRDIVIQEIIRYIVLAALATLGGWVLFLASVLFRLKQPLTLESLKDKAAELGSQFAEHPYDLTVGLARSDPVHFIAAVVISSGIIAFAFLLHRARIRINQQQQFVKESAIARALVEEAGLGGRWPHAKQAEGGAPWSAVQSEILRPENSILHILGANGIDTFGRLGSPLYDCLQLFRHETKVILVDPTSKELPGRARDVRIDPNEYKTAIEVSVRRLQDLRGQQHSIEGRYYGGQPNWKLIITSRTVWMQYYMPNGMHVDATPCWRFDITPTQDGLYHYFSMEFNRIWRRCGGNEMNLAGN